jgi:hypothetical protein
MTFRRWLETALMIVVSPWGVAAFLVLLWFSLNDWRIARNLAMGLAGVAYFPIYLIQSGNWRIFAPALALAGLLMLIAVGHDVGKWIRTRRTVRKIIENKNARMRL